MNRKGRTQAKRKV